MHKREIPLRSKNNSPPQPQAQNRKDTLNLQKTCHFNSVSFFFCQTVTVSNQVQRLHDQLWPWFYLQPYKVLVWVYKEPSHTCKLLFGPEDPLSIIHESSGWTLGTSWTRPCVNTKHWPPQWALPPTTLLTDTNTKELKGVPLRSHTHWRMSQCAAAQNCVCTVYAAFVHGHCSSINGGWSVDENQKERTSL